MSFSKFMEWLECKPARRTSLIDRLQQRRHANRCVEELSEDLQWDADWLSGKASSDPWQTERYKHSVYTEPSYVDRLLGYQVEE